MKTKNKIKIGVLGCADIAKRLVIPAMLTMEEYELVAVASRKYEKAKKFAERFRCEAIEGYENLIDRTDIDAIYIPLPTGIHYEWARKALEKQKHVFVEKSLAHEFELAKDLIDLAEKNSLGLMENFMFLYHSQHRFVIDKLSSGDIGEIRGFRSSFGFPPLPDNNIRYSKELGGGALLDAGAYTIKAAQYILGKDINVYAASLKEDAVRGIDLYGGAFLKNKVGSFAELAFGFDNYYQCNYEIWGSSGKITAERAFTAGPGFTPKILLEKQNERYEFTLPADNHFVNILKEFYNSIRSNSFDNHYEDMLNQAKLINQVRLNDKSK